MIADPPLAWIAPSAISPGSRPPPRGRFVLRVSTFLPRGRLEATQGGRALHTERCPALVPNRSVRLGARWVSALGDDASPVVVRYLSSRLRVGSASPETRVV